jgi:hypothetical protein
MTSAYFLVSAILRALALFSCENMLIYNEKYVTQPMSEKASFFISKKRLNEI